MRRHTTKSAALALLCLAPAAIAWTGAAYTLSLNARSRLWVEGTSTVRSWTCKATTFDATVDASGPTAPSLVMAGEKAVNTVSVTVPTEKMDCGNGTMNEHMLKALKAKDNPTISFHLSSYDMVKAADGMHGQLTGTLTLGGVQKPITINAVGAEEAGSLHVTGSYPLKMTEYGLKPPSLMMGTMKVNENVKVSFDLYLR